MTDIVTTECKHEVVCALINNEATHTLSTLTIMYINHKLQNLVVLIIIIIITQFLMRHMSVKV